MLPKISVLCFALCLCSISAYEDKYISQWLTDNGYTTLVSLLKAANLYDTLDTTASHSFTLFAPTNAAFAKVPNATLAYLMSNATVLAEVLQFHVVNGYDLSGQIRDGDVKAAMNGQDLHFTKALNGTITVEGATILTKDILVKNGAIHSIDSVLIPLMDTIAEILLEMPNQFSSLNILLAITDLAPTLMGGDFTLFAPTDDAFNAAGDLLPDFSNPNALKMYADILKNHLISGTYNAASLTDGQQLTTVLGQKVTVHLNMGVKVNNANVIEADIPAVNGVIHVIDEVLVPV